MACYICCNAQIQIVCYHIRVKLSYKLRISHLATDPNFFVHFTISVGDISSSNNSSDEECSEGSFYVSTDSHDDTSGSEG